VTILINNAGVASGRPLLETSDFRIRKTIEVNAISHFYTIKEFLPSMLEKNRGHIVTICSAAAIAGMPSMVEYCASKAAAFMIDECTRLEIKKIGKNVKTTCICPYFINTGMFEGMSELLGARVLD